MPQGQGWVVRPVFITSTFRDLHAERDYLRDRMFPVLEERLRERRCYLEPIDLRLGVDTASVEEEADSAGVQHGVLQAGQRQLPTLRGERFVPRNGSAPRPEAQPRPSRPRPLPRPIPTVGLGAIGIWSWALIAARMGTLRLAGIG